MTLTRLPCQAQQLGRRFPQECGRELCPSRSAFRVFRCEFSGSGFIEGMPGAVVAAPDGAVLAPAIKSRVRGLLSVVNTDASASGAYYRLAAFDAKPVESSPGEVDFINKAERALSDRRFKDADGFADSWIKACPDSADAWEYVARVRVRESREADAIAAYKKTLELEPSRISVVTSLADYLVLSRSS